MLLTILVAIGALALAPAWASAQTGGLDEYQEGVPTAGGDQSGVPGGVHNASDPQDGQGNAANGGSGPGGGDASSASPSDSTPSPARSPGPGATTNSHETRGAAASGSGGGSASGEANSTAGSAAAGAPRTVSTATSAPVEATAIVAPSHRDDPGMGLVLLIAICLLAFGAIGTILYQRKYSDLTVAPVVAPRT